MSEESSVIRERLATIEAKLDQALSLEKRVQANERWRFTLMGAVTILGILMSLGAVQIFTNPTPPVVKESTP